MDRHPISESEDTKKNPEYKTVDSKIDLNVFFKDSQLNIESCDFEDERVKLYVSSKTKEEGCPYCQEKSSRIHSRYVRTLRDLPGFGKESVIVFNARKFFCDNPLCSKKTFAEQPGNQIFRYRRRTCRCETAVYRHALALSSIQTSRLLAGIGISVSRSTVLRDLHRLRLPDTESLSKVGVDDWAFRKGVTYGTIIVDLDDGHVCDMLGTREEADFSTWLSSHPHISMVSRDRSTEYSAAIKSTGRDIIEVADRFHLLKNMSDCITKIVSENYRSCINHVNTSRENNNSENKESVSSDRLDTSATDHLKKQKEYVNETKFNEVKRLQKEGKGINETAAILGIARQTVRKYRDWEFYHTPSGKTRLPYHQYSSYVEKEYASGKDMNAIYKDVKSQGFPGSRTPFFDHFRYLMDGHRGIRSKEERERMKSESESVNGTEKIMLPPASSIALTICKDISGKELDETEIETINRLWGLNWFDEMCEAASGFWKIVKKKSVKKLLKWIEKFKKSKLPKIATFVKGIQMDLKAVKNTLVYPVSNGIVEGYVNKLKTVKRTLYGRAKLPLLQRKMIMPRWIFN